MHDGMKNVFAEKAHFFPERSKYDTLCMKEDGNRHDCSNLFYLLALQFQYVLCPWYIKPNMDAIAACNLECTPTMNNHHMNCTSQ